MGDVKRHLITCKHDLKKAEDLREEFDACLATIEVDEFKNYNQMSGLWQRDGPNAMISRVRALT